METQAAIDTAVAAYAAMGYPLPPDNPDLLNWANQNATKHEIWWSAAAYLNDPQFHSVAAKAIALLAENGPYTISQSVINQNQFHWAAQPENMRPTTMPPIVGTGAASGVTGFLSGLTPLQMGIGAAVLLMILRK